MSPIALALTAAAALAHALWNRRLHVAGDRLGTIAVAYLAVGIALLPAAVLDGPWPVWPLVLLSGAVETIYSLCLIAAYHHGALTIAYPLGRGTAPLLVTLGGWLVLNQRPDPPVLVGTVALAIGIALVATAGWRSGQSAAVGFALLTGLTVAAYSLIDSQAVQTVSAPGYFAAVSLVAGVLVVGTARGDRARLRQALRPGLRVAAGMGVAYLLVLLAFQHAEASRVSALRESSILIALWLAGERPGWQTWLGSGLVVTGVVLASVG
jgi:drug/metabolite transporter (DMT)-like permease